jgi:FdhD protein
MLPVVPAVKEVMIERVALAAAGGTLEREACLDHLAVEAPLAVSARGQRVLTVMRTPGHDLELVAGLLHAEALPPAALRAEDEHTVDVDLDPALFTPRALASVAACGVCGRQTIAELEQTSRAVEGDLTISGQILRGLPASLRRDQAIFDDTGGLHAAALATPRGELLVVREDVGRHNAVDKVVGWALAAGLPAGAHVLVVSGRLGYEIVQKAIRYGVPVVAAVSAPSSLAVELAERFGVALCGFVRGDRFNVYSHAWRVS